VTRRSRRDGPFLGFGLGLVGVENGLGSEDGGTGVNFGLGMRDGNMALEVGLLAAAVPVEGDGDLVQDLSISGLSADAKLYLPFGKTVEPYALVGLGLVSLESEGDESRGFSTALNFGGGVDIRVNRGLAIGGRYTLNGFFFDEAPSTSGGSATQTFSAMGTVTAYF